MKEEEVDQYFKNKFDGFAPVPAADAWARLQNKLEPPLPQRNTRWVYYAAAAVTCLLLSGTLFFWLRTDTVYPTGNLARQIPVISPLRTKPVGPVVAATKTGRDESVTRPEKITETIAVRGEDNRITKIQTTTTTTNKPAKKSKKIKPDVLIAAAPETVKTPAASGASLPAANQATPDAPLTLAASPPTTENVVEVVIKKDVAPAIAPATDGEFETAADALRNNLAKKGKLVKNIFKQARNLKNGEKVELSTLGLNANYRIDVESKIFKQKYTKVINL